MNASTREVFAKNFSYSLDDFRAVLPFSKRLAVENHWSRAYSRRVVAESKQSAGNVGPYGPLSKPEMHGRLLTAMTAMIALMLLGAAPEEPPPADDLPGWRGLDFLSFYLGLMTLGVATALVARWILRWPAEAPWQELPALDRLQAGYLAGGKQRSADVAITSLLERRVLGFDVATRSFTILQELEDGSRLERAILDAVRADGNVRRVRLLAAEATSSIRKTLEDVGLLMAGMRHLVMRVVPMAIMGLVLLVGIWRVYVGIARGRPVLMLVVLCLLTATLMGFFALPSTRSRWGSRMLKSLRERNVALRKPSITKVSRRPELAMAVALFGSTALAGTELAELQQPLSRSPEESLTTLSGASACGVADRKGDGWGYND